MRTTTHTMKFAALYERFSRDDELIGESNSIKNQELLYKEWFCHLIHITADHFW